MKDSCISVRTTQDTKRLLLKIAEKEQRSQAQIVEFAIREFAKKLKVKTPMIDAALKERKKSQKKPRFAHKVVAALRLGFGGHKIPKK